jgi:hypothetical protein
MPPLSRAPGRPQATVSRKPSASPPAPMRGTPPAAPMRGKPPPTPMRGKPTISAPRGRPKKDE